jgi:anti-anti-sigma factor
MALPENHTAAPGVPIVITLTGELDLADRAELWDRVDYAISLKPPGITLDLAAVTFMDSTALGAFVHARNRCDANGIALTLRSPNDQVRRLLEVSGTLVIFKIEL